MSFEEDLQFLAKNGYATIGMDELVAYIRGRGSLPEKAVVLTFDDARSSFWRFAYPLLQRYNMRGVLFVIVGLTMDAASVRTNLSSVWKGDVEVGDVEAIDPDDRSLCTWPELREMHASGWIDIESHSLFHQEVFVNSEISDILGPESSFIPYKTSATAYLTPRDIGREIVPDQYYGLPIFPTASLHQGLPGWEVSEELLRLAKRIWSDATCQDSTDSSVERTARARLEQYRLRKYLRRQTVSEIGRKIEEDIMTARDILKERVSTDVGHHFCLPYGVGSEISVQIQRSLGMESCSWGTNPGEKHNRPGTDPMMIARLKSDFIWRLPGAGQKSLFQVYGEKVGRRLRGEHVY
jgi:peptidoglycan/xylan/chitin deacetylase (PgdA/CDA1 family)